MTKPENELRIRYHAIRYDRSEPCSETYVHEGISTTEANDAGSKAMMSMLLT